MAKLVYLQNKIIVYLNQLGFIRGHEFMVHTQQAIEELASPNQQNCSQALIDQKILITAKWLYLLLIKTQLPLDAPAEIKLLHNALYTPHLLYFHDTDAIYVRHKTYKVDRIVSKLAEINILNFLNLNANLIINQNKYAFDDFSKNWLIQKHDELEEALKKPEYLINFGQTIVFENAHLDKPNFYGNSNKDSFFKRNFYVYLLLWKAAYHNNLNYLKANINFNELHSLECNNLELSHRTILFFAMLINDAKIPLLLFFAVGLFNMFIDVYLFGYFLINSGLITIVPSINLFSSYLIAGLFPFILIPALHTLTIGTLILGWATSASIKKVYSNFNNYFGHQPVPDAPSYPVALQDRLFALLNNEPDPQEQITQAQKTLSFNRYELAARISTSANSNSEINQRQFKLN